jgi:hypothetical protein
VRVLRVGVLCASGQLFRDGTPREDCVGSHPWHGVQHGCYRGGALLLTVPPAGTIALHRRLDTGERYVTLFLALNELARMRFVRGGLLADQIQVKANFVPDPGPRSGSASSSRTLVPVLASNNSGISDLLEPLGVEAGGRQARAHYGEVVHRGVCRCCAR